MQIGECLRTERMRKGLSIRQVAKDIGVHPSYVSRVERGRCSASRVFLSKIARRLGQVRDAYLKREN